jgi:hypothetical protein
MECESHLLMGLFLLAWRMMRREHLVSCLGLVDTLQYIVANIFKSKWLGWQQSDVSLHLQLSSINAGVDVIKEQALVLQVPIDITLLLLSFILPTINQQTVIICASSRMLIVPTNR